MLEVVLDYQHQCDIPTSPIADRPGLDKLLAVFRTAHDMQNETMLHKIVRNILGMFDVNPAMLCPDLEAFCDQVSIGYGEQTFNAVLAHFRVTLATNRVLLDFTTKISTFCSFITCRAQN